MIVIDTIQQPAPSTSYEFVCIRDLRCDPFDEDTHTPACHRANDLERREFYADEADEAARAFLLAGEATPIYGAAADAVTVRLAHADL